jgi:peptidyl-prolyl cis-trans isomerase A (cyclophilin A)
MKIICTLLLSFFAIAALAADPAAIQSPATNKPVVTDKPVEVLLKTSAGDIILELDTKSAPKSVANFLQYVNEGFYNNTLFHRVIPDFMIQGGGFQPGMVEKPTRSPVANESVNGKPNRRGTVAMARTQNPDSATAQFFINIVDNSYLDAVGTKPGYTVFGKIKKGMDVVDKIARVSTEQRGNNGDVPKEDVVIISARQLP